MALEKDMGIVSLVGDSNLAAGRQMSASSSSQGHGPDQINGSWWESVYKAPLPQWIQVDLGSQRTVSRLVLKTPDHWPAQNQTLTVEGSVGGSTFTTMVASARYDFTPQATIDLPGVLTRFIRLVFTANNGPGPWGKRGAFLSGFEVYGPAGKPEKPVRAYNGVLIKPIYDPFKCMVAVHEGGLIYIQPVHEIYLHNQYSIDKNAMTWTIDKEQGILANPGTLADDGSVVNKKSKILEFIREDYFLYLGTSGVLYGGNPSIQKWTFQEDYNDNQGKFIRIISQHDPNYAVSVRSKKKESEPGRGKDSIGCMKRDDHSDAQKFCVVPFIEPEIFPMWGRI